MEELKVEKVEWEEEKVEAEKEDRKRSGIGV
jgi:hypothetical protein